MTSTARSYLCGLSRLEAGVSGIPKQDAEKLEL